MRSRHRIVYERAGQDLPVLVENDSFLQRLARPLGDAAAHLSRIQQWIEHPADIVDRGVPDQLQIAGFGIDLDLGNLASVRKIALIRVKFTGAGQAGHAADFPPLRRARDIGQ